MNRYYSNAYGRFMTPDPYMASGGPADPQSWNRYAYTRGDPVNRLDPGGAQDCPADTFCFTATGTGIAGYDDYWDESPSINPGTYMSCMQDPGCYQSASANAGAGNGGGPDASEAINTWYRMYAAFTAAIATLNSDPNCDALFNLDPNAPSPVALLQSILSGLNSQVYFTETYMSAGVTSNGSMGIANAATIPTTWSSQNGSLVNTGHYGQFVVAFNYNPSAPFNSGSLGYDMTTVLHELGHIYEGLYGLGSTLLVDDTSANGTPNASASAYNDKLVQANCPPPTH